MRYTIIPTVLSLLPFATAIPAHKIVQAFHTITTTETPSGTALPASILAGAVNGPAEDTLEDADADYGITTVTLSTIETVVVVVPGVTTFSAVPQSSKDTTVTEAVER